MKKFLSVILTATILFGLFAFPCYAERYNDNYKQNVHLYEAEKEALALKEIDHDYVRNYYGDVEVLYSYKRYVLVERMGKTIAEGKYLDEIFEEYGWCFDYPNSGAMVCKLQNGMYKYVSGPSMFSDKSKVKYAPYVDFSYVEEALTSLGTDFSDPDLVVKVVDAKHYKIHEFCYIRYKGSEYIMLFNPREWVEYEHGKLYTLEEFMPWIEKQEKGFDANAKYYEETGEYLIGGTDDADMGIKQEKFINTKTAVVFSAIIVGLFAVVFAVIILRRRKAKNKE